VAGNVASTDIRPDWLTLTIARCQVLAGLVTCPSRQTLECDIPKVIDTLPPPQNVTERLVLRGLLLELYLQAEMFVVSVISGPVNMKSLRSSWFNGRRVGSSPFIVFKQACTDLVAFLPDEFADAPHVRAKKLFDARWDQQITIARLAAQLHVHPRTLRRRFREMYGMSIRTYRLKLRAQHGIDLLKYTDLRVSAIAMLVGCPNHGSFNRLIKNFSGHSPAALRATNRQLSKQVRRP
jgi:AraC-like DNA-binding protein